jgi:L-fuculose-phosphate aldolase
VDGQDPAELRAAREQLVSYSLRLLADGLAVGSAGNLSVRVGDLVTITPSGISYQELRPSDIAVVTLGGIEADAPEEPSSELPMHLAIYAATGGVTRGAAAEPPDGGPAAEPAGAVVHTHSPEVIALSATCDELPAIHYAITTLGGPVRVAPYVRFGSAGLADAAAAALAGRHAAILRNHGAVTYGRTLAEAYDHALLLEWLARVYRLSLCYGTPRILSAAELDEVAAETRRRGYGTRRRNRAAQDR